MWQRGCEKLLDILGWEATRYFLSWLVASAAAALVLLHAWRAYDDVNRPEGNAGHTYIDFGGQYIMGQMLLKGHGHELYNRSHLRHVISKITAVRDGETVRAYPPKETDDFLEWFMGKDNPGAERATAKLLVPWGASDPLSAALLTSAAQQEIWTPDVLETAGKRNLGGVIYPPVHMIYFAPFAIFEPHVGYRVHQVLSILLAFVAGGALTIISRGRVWWPIASLYILLFPGFGSATCLGQNSAWTIAMVAWGWAFVVCNRLFLGGCAWGLLAYKPTWAVAFLVVPLLTSRWRMLAGMVATGAAIVFVSMAIGGWQNWYDYRVVADVAATTDFHDENWIFLGRDVFGIPRRFLDFNGPWEQRRDHELALRVGWGIWWFVAEITILAALFRRTAIKAVDGPGPAFVILGAILTCYHFMYYDILVAALPMFLLFADPMDLLRPRLVTWPPWKCIEGEWQYEWYFEPDTVEWYPDPKPKGIGVLSRAAPNFLLLLLIIEYAFPHLKGTHFFDGGGNESLAPNGQPYDTFCLMILWFWLSGILQWLTRRSVRFMSRWGLTIP